MERDEKTSDAAASDVKPVENPAPANQSDEPPKVYIASCGTLCDVFWWARRRS